MLYSVELKLKRESDNHLPVMGYHAMALFLYLLEGANPVISAQLHDDSSVKPFTTSVLVSRRREEKELSVRLTFLHEEIFTAFLDAVWRLPAGDRLTLCGSPVTLSGVATAPGQSKWAGFGTFEGILDSVTIDRKLAIAFLSPTTFRSKGRRNVLFPEPSLVFGSLLNRWNAFAPKNRVLVMNEGMMSAVHVSSYRLTTRMLDFGDYQELGFQGNVSYQLSERLSDDGVRVFQALGEFAFYSGVGAKTTMGMGQTRRVTDARSIPDRARGYAEERRRGVPRHQG